MNDEQNLDDLEDIEDIESSPFEEPQSVSDGRKVYNVVSDIGFGANFRMSDNCFQAAFIFTSVLVGAGVGALIGSVGGAIIGAFAGLLGGLLLSGIILMVYRAVQHAKGRHD